MAEVRCPACGSDMIPFAIERQGHATTYVCPACRGPLTIDLVDEYLAREEEEAG